MTDTDFDLPSDWVEQSLEDTGERQLVQVQRTTANGTSFIVAVLSATNTDQYVLRFSTIEPQAIPTRHDYRVQTYGSRDEVLAAADSFVDHVDGRLRDETISATNPDIASIEEMIQAFRGTALPEMLRRLVHELR